LEVFAMNLNLQVIGQEVCLVDSDSQGCWPLFSNSPYENLSDRPIYVKKRDDQRSVWEIYLSFLANVLNIPQPTVLALLPYIVIGGHIIREMMSRNQPFSLLAAGAGVSYMKASLLGVVKVFHQDSQVYLQETSEILPLLKKKSISCMVIDAKLLEGSEEIDWVGLAEKISDNGLLIFYGMEEDLLLNSHAFFGCFTKYGFWGFQILEKKIDRDFQEELQKNMVFSLEEKLAAAMEAFEKLKKEMGAIFGAGTSQPCLSNVKQAVSRAGILEREIARCYPRLKNLDLKWEANLLKEALIIYSLALEDSACADRKREILAGRWEAFFQDFQEEFQEFLPG